MELFKFYSEITDIGLRISFKESGVKFTEGSKDFRHKKFKVLKFEPVMSGRKWGVEISPKNRYR